MAPSVPPCLGLMPSLMAAWGSFAGGFFFPCFEEAAFFLFSAALSASQVPIKSQRSWVQSWQMEQVCLLPHGRHFGHKSCLSHALNGRNCLQERQFSILFFFFFSRNLRKIFFFEKSPKISFF